MNISVVRDKNNCNIKPTLVIWQCRFKTPSVSLLFFMNKSILTGSYLLYLNIKPEYSPYTNYIYFRITKQFKLYKATSSCEYIDKSYDATYCRIKRFAPPVLGSHFLVYLLHNILTLVVYLIYSTKPNELLWIT